MATFAELVADVKTLTNRPDLDSEIKLAVKKATLKAHHSDFYPKDLYEVGITWATPAYTQSLEYRTLIPRFRAIKWLRKTESATADPGAFLTLVTPEQVLDSYSLARSDIFYLAGEQLEIKSSTQDDFMLLGCYLHPDITENGYSSWIALDHPFLIEYEATAAIFKQIGFDEQAAQIRQEVAEQYAELKLEITAGGF